MIDGLFQDWERIPPAASAPDAKASNDEPGLKSLRITDDGDYLYLMLELKREILLQEGNRLTLYIEHNKEAINGQALTGPGTRLSFTFGERRGRLQRGSEELLLEHQHLGLVGAPSVTSHRFELALSWNARGPDGRPALVPGPLRIHLSDDGSGTALPLAGSIDYHPKLTPRPALPPLHFERQAATHLRLVTHNVNRRHFQPDKKDAFTRIYRALDPDILLLQEAYEGSAEAILEYFRPALGPSRTGQWYAYKAGEEATVLLSPYPAREIVPLGNSAAYLLDLPSPSKSGLVIIALSLPCCRQDSARQAEADRIMAFVRDLRTPGGTIDLERNTPIVLAGDANLVGYREQYLTLLEGKIQDTFHHGPPFAPDWDDTPLKDLHPALLQAPMTFTWRGNSFFPGRLDYIFFSDSVLDTGRHFIFDTVGLPRETLEHYQLKESDAPDTYHHLPLVVDFVP